MNRFKLIALGFVLTLAIAACSTICSYVPIPGVCSASPSATATP